MNYKTIVSIICLFALVMGINLFVGSVDAFPQKQLPSQAQGPDVEKIKEQLDTIIERMNDLPEQARAQERVKELRRRLEEYRSLIEGIEIAPLNWCYDFNNDLGVGDTGDDVKALHDALREEGFSTPSDEESFNLLTASSVVGFQQKYEEEILHPLDFSYGTGFVCSSTREKLNEIYGCQEEAEPTCEEGVEKAQEYAEDKICTTEAATMECPTEDDYTYDAVNGCEISFLEDIDWERVDDEDPIEPTCEEGVEKAQEYAEDKICTTEAATMECPTEDDYTYDAVNGCEISFLEDIDWERLSELDDKNE